MADTPWGIVPEVSDRLRFMDDFFNSSPKSIADLFDDVIAPPSPQYDPQGQIMNYLTPFDSPMRNFGNNAIMPSDVGGEGSQTTLAGGESITNSLIEISEKRGSTDSLKDHEMCKELRASNSEDDDPLHILRAEAEAGINPLAEIFGRRSNTILEDPLQILPEQNHPSQLYEAGGSVAKPLVDHSMPIFEAGEESNINPLAEIFGKWKSTILQEDPLQILPVENHSLKLYEAGGSFSNTLDVRPIPMSGARGELSINPLAENFGRRSTILLKEPLQTLPAENYSLKLYEVGGSVSKALDDLSIPIFGAGRAPSINPLAKIFRERKNAVLLGDQPQHIFKEEGESSLSRNLNHNSKSFKNNNLLPPFPVDQLSGHAVHSSCIDCHGLKELFYYNHSFSIKIEVHGKWGVICHAIQERRALFLNNNDARGEPVYEKFDFHSQSLNEVKHFLTHYSEGLKAVGYIRQPDPVQSFLQGFHVQMEDEDEWDEVLSYPEEFLYEEFGIENFDPPKSYAKQLRHVEKASSSKGKGKMRGRPPKRPRFSPAEQRAMRERREKAAKMRETAAKIRERAADMKLEDLRAYFHLSIEEASDKLGLPVAVVKKLCRKFGICRWPNIKQLRAISKEISTLQPLLLSYRKGTRDYVAARIDVLEKEKAVLFASQLS